jgi:hypothetical protein
VRCQANKIYNVDVGRPLLHFPVGRSAPKQLRAGGGDIRVWLCLVLCRLACSAEIT